MSGHALMNLHMPTGTNSRLFKTVETSPYHLAFGQLQCPIYILYTLKND